MFLTDPANNYVLAWSKVGSGQPCVCDTGCSTGGMAGPCAVPSIPHFSSRIFNKSCHLPDPPQPLAAPLAALLQPHYTPHCNALLALLCLHQVNLMEAERAGLEHPECFVQLDRLLGAPGTTPAPAAATADSNGVVGEEVPLTGGKGGEQGSSNKELGQLISLAFIAPRAGSYNLSLVIMSNCWVGADEALPVRGHTLHSARSRALSTPHYPCVWTPAPLFIHACLHMRNMHPLQFDADQAARGTAHTCRGRRAYRSPAGAGA